MISLCLHVAEASVNNNVVISRVIAAATTIDTLVLILMGNVDAILCLRYNIRGVLYWLMMNDSNKRRGGIGLYSGMNLGMTVCIGTLLRRLNRL